MLFSKEKKILKIIRKSKPNLSNDYYDHTDIWMAVQRKYRNNINETEYMSALKALDEEGFISFSSKTRTAFQLNNIGRFYYQFLWKQFLSYLFTKWIDILALVIAGLSLLLSIFNTIKLL